MNVILKYLLVYFVIISNAVSARDVSTTAFIKSFIINEGKPTFLIYNDLCWSKSAQMNLAKEMSNSSIRFSTSIKLNKYLDHQTLFLVDLDCPNAEEILFNATSKNLFRSPYRWLVLSHSSSTDERKIASLLECPLLSDSDLVFAQKSQDGYKMVELHKSSPNHSIQYTPRGYYNGTLVDIRIHRELFRRRRDVMGHALTMANVIQDSNSTQYHLDKEDRLDLHNDVDAKVCWINIKLAFQMLNATPRYIFSHRWGYKRNGQWSGMVEDLLSGRADVGTNLFMSAERLDAITFTEGLSPLKVRFIFRQSPLPYVTNIFSLPFSSGVWIATGVCAVVSTMTLYLASKVEAALGKSPTQLDGLRDSILVTISALSQQGCIMEPRKISGRMIMWLVFASLMALYTAYSANIVVLLQAPSNSITSLSQLARSKFTIAANDLDYNYFLFKLDKDPLRVDIYKRIESKNGKAQFYDLNEGVERIRQGLFAFHSIVEPVYRRIEETFLEAEKCDLTEVDFLNTFDPFTGIKKDSPYTELLRVVIKQILESGIQSAVYKRFHVPKPRCNDKASSFNSVGLLDLRAVMFLILIGTAASIIIVFIEIIIHRLSKRVIVPNNIKVKINKRICK